MGKILEDLPAIRRKFHQYPERGWCEFWTASEICNHLEKLDFDIQYGKELFKPELRMGMPDDEELNKWYQKALERGADSKYLEKMKGGFTGVIGFLDTGKPGPTFAYEVEIDALPGVSEYDSTGKPTQLIEDKSEDHRPTREGWASENEGIMHACGHDVHIAMGLGVAEYISEHKDSLRGKFILMFSPAEEGGQGAKSYSYLPFIKDINYYFAYHDAAKAIGGGILFLPRVFLRSIEQYSVEYSLKPGPSAEQLLIGQLMQDMQTGKFKSQAEFINAYVEGLKGIPEPYSNPLNAAMMAYSNLHAIPKRSDGLAKFNVFDFKQGKGPSFSVSFALTLRADTNSYTEYIRKQAIKILEAAASIYDIEVNITKDEQWSYPAWEKNDEELVQLAMGSWHELYGPTVVSASFGDMGTDDDVFLMNEIKKHGGKCLYAVIVSDTQGGATGELHTNKFDIDDSLLTAGVTLTTKMIEKLLL